MGPTDVPTAYMVQVAEMESGGNPHAQSKNSSAAGLYQFTRDTWDKLRRQNPQLNLTASGRLDPEQSDRAFRLFTAQNATLLAKTLGRDPVNGELYLAHFLGGLGATRILTASPNTPLVQIVGAHVMHKNRFLSSIRTTGALRSWAIKIFAAPHSTAKVQHRDGRWADALNETELNRVKEPKDEAAR